MVQPKYGLSNGTNNTMVKLIKKGYLRITLKDDQGLVRCHER